MYKIGDNIEVFYSSCKSENDTFTAWAESNYIGLRRQCKHSHRTLSGAIRCCKSMSRIYNPSVSYYVVQLKQAERTGKCVYILKTPS